jgi:uncharacterized protein YjbI with pentapeptide repeats
MNKEVNFIPDQKHLDLLSSGKTLWNKWRRENADVQTLEPDLHEADLDGAILIKAIFDEDKLSRVDLSGADIDKFDIREAERTEVRA